jgi:hypothetical protein
MHAAFVEVLLLDSSRTGVGRLDYFHPIKRQSQVLVAEPQSLVVITGKGHQLHTSEARIEDPFLCVHASFHRPDVGTTPMAERSTTRADDPQ